MKPDAPEPKPHAHSWARRQWRRRTHSIKGRLVALFVLLALATTAVFLLGTQRLLKTGWQAFVQPLVADYAERLAADLGTPPDPARALALTQQLPLALRVEGPQLRLDTHPGHFDRPTGHRDRDDRQAWAWTVERADGHRVSFAFVAPPDTERPRFFGWATLAALLVLTALAYVVVRRQLKPLDDIGVRVQAYGRGDFSTAIPVRREDELGELARRINNMAQSLSGMLDAKRALLLAMSHELRSPLTRARVNAELLDDSPERSALLRDLGEMRDQISALLEGEQLADGHSALRTEAVDLAALATEAAAADAEAHPDAEALVLALPRPPLAAVRADPQRLRLLLRNLLENARRHGCSADGQAPHLFLRQQADGRIALGVRDHGAGISADQLPQLAQAFYRPDSARSRSRGGVGLGLYLCRLVAQAHGGELQISDAQPGLMVAMVWSPGAP